MIFLIGIFDFFWGRRLVSTAQRQKAVMELDEKEALTDRPLLIKSLFILGMVIIGFILAEHLHIANGTIAMFGGALLMLLYTWGSGMKKETTGLKSF
jgi:Na+/H+ antiporter NhaD/arsenite permease-like protein